MLAYGLVLYVKTIAPIASVSAIRESSVIIAALIGVVFLGERPWMGRVVSAIIVAHDEAGIAWPRTIAPFDVHMVLIGAPESPQADLADRLLEELSELGLEVLLDDRADTKPGEKFVEAELLGCPIRVTVGARTLPDGPVEVQVRRGRERRDVPLDGAAAAILALWEACD